MLLLPRIARAQTARRRRIALLSPFSRAMGAPYLTAFREGLRALGYGDNDIEIESREADGHFERLPDLAAELVRLDPEVIVGTVPPAIQAAKQATSTIPIVMVNSGEPVAAGFIASLAHPGGNITGLSSSVSPEIAGKWVDLLKTTIPRAERVAFLVDPGNHGHAALVHVAQQAAQTLRIGLIPVEARAPGDIDSAFAAVKREHVQALIVPGDTLFGAERSRIIDFATGQRLPTLSMYRENVMIGGLMSYGADLKDLSRRAATYVDKILKGAKPADLPVEQPTKFELVVNLKAARALGLTIPPLILAGADEVIE